MRIIYRVTLVILLCITVLFLVMPLAVVYGQTADRDDWYLGAIQAPEDLVPKGASKPIVVAIVDDGMRLTHHDLADFIWRNAGEIPDNGIDDDGNGFVDDVHGWDVADNDGDVSAPENRTDFYHGTHVGGIVAQIARHAYGDSATRFVRIMPVKSLSDGASSTYIKDGYRGIAYAVHAGADIIISSWGAAEITPAESGILQDAADKDILIVASGGNLPEERQQYPAAHDSVLAIASTDRNRHKSIKSNYGQFIDISAPGEDIRSAGIYSDTDHATRDGSSFSAAMVAATAALIKLQHPDFTRKEIEVCLKSSSIPFEISDRNYSAKLGAGKLDAKSAVACDLLTTRTKDVHRLTHPKGFLHLKKKGALAVNWAIEPDGEFKGIRFTPIVGRDAAIHGQIEFRADDALDAPVLAQYSLDALPASIYVPGTSAYVTVTSTKRRQRVDWLLEYAAETINFSTLYCRGTREISSEGILTDGSGLENYSAQSDCKWLITAPEGQVIQFRFSKIDTEANRDLLYFFNGSGSHEKIMAILSGNKVPPEFTTWGNQVLVWFVSDGKNQGQGWEGTYRFQDQPGEQ